MTFPVRIADCRFNPMKALSEFAKDALELTPVQRLALARILLDSTEVDQNFSPSNEDEWENEIVRRMDEVKAGAVRSSGFKEVFARLDRFEGP